MNPVSRDLNPVLILTHNCLEMTKRCVESVLKQDIPVSTFVIDNGSTDGTDDWLADMLGQVGSLSLGENAGVSKGWNEGLNMMFEFDDKDHVLVINNDTVIPPWFYHSLAACGFGFVTGVSVGSMEEIAVAPSGPSLIEAPDFSAFYVCKDVWKAIGVFDENMVMYCQDLDYHIRAHRAGINLWNAQIPFFHQRSSTLNQAPSRERHILEMRADDDRAAFKEKWGCTALGPSYEAMFTPETFGIEKTIDISPRILPS